VFIFTQSYWVALAGSVLLLSIGSAALPQMFTMGRLYSDKQLGPKSDLFMSLLRAAIAVAWVIGPPLAFLFKAEFGFAAAFSAAIACALLMILIATVLPEYAAQPSDQEQLSHSVQWHRSAPIVFYLLACVFMFCASTMYNTSIPLYLSKELLLDAQWAGYLMGLAALLEIPFMLLAGLFGPRFGYKRSIAIGLLAGALFYICILNTTAINLLMLAQLFNGVFVAIISTLGMILIQNMMRHELGLATTLFTNAQQLSSLLGGLLVGVIAQWADYYSVYIACLVLTLMSLAFLAMVQIWQTSQIKKQVVREVS
jgi:SET family sugar efflux transporter-like MFS transporter